MVLRAILIAAISLWLAPLASLAGGGAPDGGFVAGLEDLPLMDGLVEHRDAGVVFDKPGGRLVEAYASGAAEAAEVAAFYRATLPELGWRRIAEMTFLREGEVLRIHMLAGEDGLTVRFFLSPQ